jgi:hypothetical protein
MSAPVLAPELMLLAAIERAERQVVLRYLGWRGAAALTV